MLCNFGLMHRDREEFRRNVVRGCSCALRKDILVQIRLGDVVAIGVPTFFWGGGAALRLVWFVDCFWSGDQLCEAMATLAISQIWCVMGELMILLMVALCCVRSVLL